MARKKRNRLAAYELVEWQYAQRYARKGWMERNFNIGGRWYLWRKNVASERGIFRFGVLDKTGDFERQLERS